MRNECRRRPRYTAESLNSKLCSKRSYGFLKATDRIPEESQELGGDDQQQPAGFVSLSSVSQVS